MTDEYADDDYAATTQLAHDDAFPSGAVVPPIYQTSLFTFANYAEMEAAFSGQIKRPIYSRGNNPTVQEFERKIATLEGAEAARGTASGMAAISSAVLSIASAGDRILCTCHVYGDSYRFFEKLLPRVGITVDYVDAGDFAAVEAALPGAKLLYLENPTSMVFGLQEIGRLAALAKAHGAATIIDNSWATPLFQQPLKHGVDLVVHSASKYLSGHSDTVAGVIAGSAERIARVNDLTYPYLGGKLSPFEAWLLIRGMRTLPLRMRQHQESGLAIARRLADHPLVTRVLHPAFSNHPGGATLTGHSGLFSFEVGDRVDVPRFIDGLRLFKLGVSWGGHESLAIPAQASLRQAQGPNALSAFGVTPRIVRIAVGLEDTEDLWADLDRALLAAG